VEITIKDYDEFVEDLKIKINQESYEDIIFDGFKNAIDYSIGHMAKVELEKQYETLMRETAKEIILPKIKEKIKEKMTDKVIAGIVNSICKEIVELAKDIEKDDLRIRRYINGNG